MTQETAVTVRELSDIQTFALPDAKTLKGKLDSIKHFQALVQDNLIEGIDYGRIPGIKNPSLFQSGAEKIAKLLELAEYYDIIGQIEDWDKGFFYYQIKCTLKLIGTDIVVSQGLGSGNSKEPKWAYRWLWPNDVPSNMDKSKMVTRKTKQGGWQYRIDNEEIFEIVNTILKISKKRSFIDAVKSAGRLSNLFTQDVEDITALNDGEDAEVEGDEQETPKETKPSKLGNCPDCGKPLAERDGKYGSFISCTGYPKCKYKPPKDKPIDNPAPAVESVTVEQESPVAALEVPSRDIYEAGCRAAQEVLQWTAADHKKFLSTWGVAKYGEVTVAQRQVVLDALKVEIDKIN
jgi:ssDNA-binding Zn-finger/Zn-ribbon topoisomerase 1